MTIQRELFGFPTGHCMRAAIALEEAGLTYTPRRVNLSNQENREDTFLQINPGGKVPVLIDHTGPAPFVLTQSNAIILYAARQAPGKLLADSEEHQSATALERFFFFTTDVIAFFNAGFHLSAPQYAESKQSLRDRYVSSIVYSERFVADSAFMAGDRLTIADISAFTVIRAAKESLPWESLPHLSRWYASINDRPAFQRGLSAFNAAT